MRSTLSEIFARRVLLLELTRTELAVAQHRNRLGWLWWLIDPLIFIGIFWIFKTILLGREAYAPYPMFVGSALIAWRFFSNIVNKSAGMIRSRASLIRSVAFPLAVLPVSRVAVESVFFLIALIILTCVAPLFGVSIGSTVIQLPALFLAQVVLALGLSLFAAGIGMVIYDLPSIMSHLLRVVFYLSPVIYGANLVVSRFGEESIWSWIYLHSPLAILFHGYRSVLWDPGWMAASDWAWLVGEAVAMLVIGYLVFLRFEGNAVKMMH